MIPALTRAIEHSLGDLSGSDADLKGSVTWKLIRHTTKLAGPVPIFVPTNYANLFPATSRLMSNRRPNFMAAQSEAKISRKRQPV